MRTKTFRIVLSIFAFLAAPVWAQIDLVDGALERADALSLAIKPQWQKLLHYRDTNLLAGKKSEVDDPAFFLSPSGKDDPEAELIATIDYLLSDPEGRCRFPARFIWLSEQLLWRDNDHPFAQCVEYLAWRSELSADSITLIFPGSYLNNPSSMFGHLFIRLDQSSKQNRSDLLAPTLNYGATVPDGEGGALYAFKGITGWYQGVVAILPYYEQIKKYNDLENRAIWEYQLNIAPDKVALFLAHIWEIRNIKFDYFFFDENCAYRILSLIDVVYPNRQLMDGFDIYAMPADVVRVLDEQGLVISAQYRPSLIAELSNEYDQLNEQSQHLYAEVINNPLLLDNETLFVGLDDAQKQRLYFSLASYARNALNHEKPGSRRDALRYLAHNALLKGNQFDQQVVFEPLKPPKVRDDQGHRTFKFSIGERYRDNRHSTLINFRPAFHGLTDPAQGYLSGAQILFLDTTLSWQNNQAFSDWHLDELMLLNIQSLIPVDVISRRWSWGLDASYKRQRFNDKIIKRYNFSGNMGRTYRLGGGDFYVLGQAALKKINGGEIKSGLFAGGQIGYLYYFNHGQLQLLAQYAGNFVDSASDDKSVLLEYVHNLDQNNSVGFSVGQDSLGDLNASEFNVNFNFFF